MYVVYSLLYLHFCSQRFPLFFFFVVFSVISCAVYASTSGRLVGLLVCMALAAAMLFLPVFHIVAFEQMFYFAGEK